MKKLSFATIIEMFFPNDLSKSDENSYLMHLIQPGLIHRLTHNDMTVLFDLPLEYFTYEYFYLWFAQMWGQYYIANPFENKPKVYTDKILSLMIAEEILPAQICRLPRLNKDRIGFDIIPEYYEKHLDYNKATDDEIIFHVKNYCSSTPITLTYSEAVRRVSQAGHPQSLIKTNAKDKKLPVYLQVPEESTTTDSQMRRLSRQSIEYFRELNCGNPSYNKRYNGLERLTQSSINTLFDGKTIRIKDNEHCMRRLAVQTTDIECRGKKEDKDLELEFRRVCDGANQWGVLPFDIILADKKSNSCGLQLADLIARPIGRYVLDPQQENRAYSIIEKKIYCDKNGKKEGWGIKCFP